MGFLSKLMGLGKAQPKGKGGYVTAGRQARSVDLRSVAKCGEKIPVRLRTTSELQRREGPDTEQGPGMYFVRKTVVGKKCYQRIEASVEFDFKYDVVDHKVTNGRLITCDEYNQG